MIEEKLEQQFQKLQEKRDGKYLADKQKDAKRFAKLAATKYLAIDVDFDDRVRRKVHLYEANNPLKNELVRLAVDKKYFDRYNKPELDQEEVLNLARHYTKRNRLEKALEAIEFASATSHRFNYQVDAEDLFETAVKRKDVYVAEKVYDLLEVDKK